ncbi:MAG: hypothetical protein KC589_09215, partial [Nanoarchaeota archaeon]|nr:hypothetical protein [Nanoarchaeota archaeon]
TKNGEFWFFNDTYGGTGLNNIHFTPNPTVGANIRGINSIISDDITNFNITHIGNEAADRLFINTGDSSGVSTNRITVGCYEDLVDVAITNVRGVAIGTSTPNSSAILDVSSTTGGLLMPRMTSTQASAITPVNGLVVYVTDTNGTFTNIGFWGYSNGSWIEF